MILCSIYDTDAEEYSAPFAIKNEKVAVSGFKNDLRNVLENSLKKRTGIDITKFVLYKVADYYPEEQALPICGCHAEPLYFGSDFDVEEYNATLKQLKMEDSEVNNG